MQMTNSDILNHFYGLLLEMNFRESDDEILGEGDKYKDDLFIEKHLRHVRLQSAKLRALQQKSVYQLLLIEFKRIKDLGTTKIRELLSAEEVQQLQPLFNRFEQLSEKDSVSIGEDQQLLQLLSVLKDKLNNSAADE